MAKESFADIYEQWTRTHDEQKEIKSKVRTSNGFTESRSSGSRSAVNGANGYGSNKYVSNANGSLTINEMRRMNAQDELDLHEFRLEEAIVRTRTFLDDARKKKLRKVRIITGKGIHSKTGEPVLKPAITEVARNHPAVREVSTPKAAEGGSGALTVILKG